jgi:winged helix DNA-binding protein
MPTRSVLKLEREQIVAFRRRVAALDERLPPGGRSIETAAFAGLQDSMPRAAQLSLFARVDGVGPSAWQEPPLVQVWGPRFSVYAIAERDVAVFTLGRHPHGGAQRRRAEALAERLREHLGDEWRRYDDVGAQFGVKPNALRYATTTGTVLLRWDGARRPLIRSVSAPELDIAEARLELARRYLHAFAPGTATGFGDWAGIRQAGATAAFEALASSLTPVRTAIGEAWILSADEAELRRPVRQRPTATARLLPSGDTLSLLQGRERELLVPNPADRARLWTPRVWPGAVLVGGEVRGTWRRAREVVSVEMWGDLSSPEREAIEAEAAAMPLPGLEDTRIRVRWEP